MGKAAKKGKRQLPEALRAHSWKKGQTGNPKGKNGWTEGTNLVKELCRECTEEAHAALLAMARDSLTPLPVKKEIWIWMCEMAGGKPAQAHEGADGSLLAALTGCILVPIGGEVE